MALELAGREVVRAAWVSEGDVRVETSNRFYSEAAAGHTVPGGHADRQPLGPESTRTATCSTMPTCLLAEDTRHTAQLLHACGIERAPGSMESLHEHNERERAPRIVERLRSGEIVALVSDAGTPW